MGVDRVNHFNVTASHIKSGSYANRFQRVDAEIEWIVTRLNTGESKLKEEAAKYKCSPELISKRRRSYMGDDYYDLRTVGSVSGDMDLIIALYDSGMSVKEIAEKFDKSAPCMSVTISKHLERNYVPDGFVNTSARAVHLKEVEFDGSTKYALNHRRGECYAVIPMDEYLRLSSTTDK